MNPTGSGGLLRPPPPLPPPPLPPPPFHQLDVTVVSAQDLHPAVRSSMRTYAVAWLTTDPADKRRTIISSAAHTEPTWNHKLSFRLDDATLDSDTAALNFDIYAARSKLRPGTDTLLGTARALISTVQPSHSLRLVALQVRRPSLRPQGMLNVGFALADDYGTCLPREIYSGRKKKGEEEEETAAEVRLERRNSAEEMEKKLEMWRVELPRTAKEEERERSFARKSRRTTTTTTTLRLAWLSTDSDDGGGGNGGGEKPDRG